MTYLYYTEANYRTHKHLPLTVVLQTSLPVFPTLLSKRNWLLQSVTVLPTATRLLIKLPVFFRTASFNCGYCHQCLNQSSVPGTDQCYSTRKDEAAGGAASSLIRRCTQWPVAYTWACLSPDAVFITVSSDSARISARSVWLSICLGDRYRYCWKVNGACMVWVVVGTAWHGKWWCMCM